MARKVLLSDSGNLNGRPRHIFGDILDRISRKTHDQLFSIYHKAEQRFEKGCKGLENRDGASRAKEEAKRLGAALGAEMMSEMINVMKHIKFPEARQAKCYKHSGDVGPGCPLHFNNVGNAFMTIYIAGTTCTSFSRMGAQKKWLAMPSLVFIVWAFDTLAALPHLIVHECTPAFELGLLVTIFGALYQICSNVFSPMDLGVPCSRPRRYTIMLRKGYFAETVPYHGAGGFRELFFRRVVLTGHAFCCAPAKFVKKYATRLADKRGDVVVDLTQDLTNDSQPSTPSTNNKGNRSFLHYAIHGVGLRGR